MFFGSFGLLAGCREPQLVTHPLDHPLPTQAIVKGSVFEVQKAIEALWEEHPEGIFTEGLIPPPPYELYWRGKRHPSAITIFKEVINENDVYVSCGGKAICRTQVYTDRYGHPLDLTEDIQVHLIPQGSDETLVKVIGIGTRVLLEDRYWWGGRKGRSWTIPVEATTQEENQVLERIQEMTGKG